LQNLLQEKIPVRDMRTIAETLAEHAATSQDAGVLTAHVRIALGRSIVQQISGMGAELPVLTLDPTLEQLLHQTLQGADQAGGLEPGLAENLHRSLIEQAQRQEASGHTAVLLVSSAIRAMLARFVRHSIPNMHVLSFNEIPDNKQVRITATVGA
jgi:flagellar biosynthesis protein FlhA